MSNNHLRPNPKINELGSSFASSFRAAEPSRPPLTLSRNRSGLKASLSGKYDSSLVIFLRVLQWALAKKISYAPRYVPDVWDYSRAWRYSHPFVWVFGYQHMRDAWLNSEKMKVSKSSMMDLLRGAGGLMLSSVSPESLDDILSLYRLTEELPSKCNRCREGTFYLRKLADDRILWLSRSRAELSALLLDVESSSGEILRRLLVSK